MSGGTNVSAAPIVELLSRMEDIYSELVRIGEAKTQVIIQNDIDNLVKLSQQESKCLKQLASLEQEREEAVQSFLQSKGIKSQLKLTVTEITKLIFEANERQEMLAVQERIRTVLEKLKFINDHNQTLIQQSIHFIEYQLNLHIDYSDQDMLYRRPEQAAPQYSRPGMMDTRA
ncbi:flagellar protein FlgN [Paenibacillus dendritiformis]|nr:flagellar protein FlgN [Paenibacillus dendritiformis]